MSDLNNVVINRNETDKPLNKFKIVKGKKEGKEYLAPQVSLETFDSDIKWLGKVNVISIIQKWLKASAQSIFFSSFDAEGNFNQALFISEMTNLTETGMKLKEINEQLDEVEATLGLILQQAEVDDETGQFKDPAVVRKMRELNNTKLALRAQRDARSCKGKGAAEAAEEDADPAVVVA
jgi:hypothetical protein